MCRKNFTVRARILVLCALSLGLSAVTRGEIELRGMFRAKNQYSFALTAGKNSVGGKWVKLGAHYQGYLLSTFDPSNGVLKLVKEDRTLELSLAAEVSSLPVFQEPDTKAAASLPSEELASLGLYRVADTDNPARLPFSAGISPGELKVLNPEVDFRTVRPGDILVVSPGLPKK